MVGVAAAATAAATHNKKQHPHRKSDRNWEKWEKFRESKMEKMRVHKYNVERRMKYDYNNDKRYWSQRNDKLKRYPKQEALDPSWYTDNIYSNQSIDLDEDNYYHQSGSNNKRDNFFHQHDINGNNSYFDGCESGRGCGVGGRPDDVFSFAPIKPTTPIRVGEYRYPKSSSCCFGGGVGSYESKPIKSSVPKSHSFSHSETASNFAKIREIKNTYHGIKSRPISEMMDYQRHREGLNKIDEFIHHRNYENGDNDRERYNRDEFIFTRICDRDGCINETCLTTKAVNKINIQNDLCHQDGSEDDDEFCLNAWDDRGKIGKKKENCRRKSEMDTNVNHRVRMRPRRGGNLIYDEDFLQVTNDDSSVYEDAQLNCDRDMDSGFNRHNSFVEEMDQLIRCERQKLAQERLRAFGAEIDDFNKSFEDVFSVSHYRDNNYRSHHRHKQGIQTAANTKSMLEVKPPNKYDDTSSDSTDLDLDDFNFDFEKYWEELDKSPSPLDISYHQPPTSKNINNTDSNMKVKNNNIGRYNNGSLIDSFHDSILPFSPPPKNNSCFDTPQPSGYINNLVYNDNYAANFFHPSPPNSNLLPTSPLHKFNRKVYPEPNPIHQKYNNFYPQESPHNPHQPISASSTSNNNAISLINNIFSIYKPNKYSPLNCHTQHIGFKPEPCKKMAVPSTIRPLGENDLMTSLKRPLIVKPLPGQEQARFKIIPEKTGLKISPLYRFDFGGTKKKLKLKSTARPLLFPH